MIGWFDVPETERPPLPQRAGAVPEVKCPCGRWRPAFCMARLDAPRDGQDWACDGCRTRWDREAENG